MWENNKKERKKKEQQKSHYLNGCQLLIKNVESRQCQDTVLPMCDTIT